MSRFSSRYLAKRLGYSYLTVVVVISLIFMFVQTRPGSIADVMGASGMGPQKVAEMEQTWATNEPIWEQFLRFQFNYQTGNFGYSLQFETDVLDAIVRRAAPTLILFGSAFIFAFVFGPVVGAYVGWHRGTRRDKLSHISGMVTYSVPSFWLAFLLLWGFWARWDVLPARYMFTQFPRFEWTPITASRDLLIHAVLPLLALSITSWFGTMIVMRTVMINETDKAYIHLAEAKGLSDRAVMFKHAARNALIPVVTQGIVVVSFLIGGSVIIERIFSWRGLGDLLVTSIETLDLSVLFGTFFVLSLLVVFVRLCIDFAYTYLDPRVAFGQEHATRDAPPVHYPGRWKAIWGALGHLAIVACMFPIAIRRREELIGGATIRPFSGNTPAVNWIPDRLLGPEPITDFFDPTVISDVELTTILAHNAHFSGLSLPVEVFQETGPVGNSAVDSLVLGNGIMSFQVNFLLEAPSPELLAVFLIPPVVYMMTGILATRNATDAKPLGRGLKAARQFTGTVPVVLASLYIAGFTVRTGNAAPNPLYSLILAGVIYPAVFGLLGGYVAGKLRVGERLRLAFGRGTETTTYAGETSDD